MLAPHFGIRELIYDVLASSRGDPVVLSFVGSLRVACTSAITSPGFAPQVVL